MEGKGKLFSTAANTGTGFQGLKHGAGVELSSSIKLA